MNSEPAIKSEEQARNELEQLLLDIDVEIINKFDEGDFWGYWVKFGDFPILIENQRPKRFCVVAFQITLSEGPPITHLNEYYARSDSTFIYELTKAFTSPLTGFSRIVESGRVVGFTITRYIYPFYPDFSIKDLDRAVQAVVSQGAIGIAFLKMTIGELRVERMPEEPGGD
jgi:hypothetical protein